MPVTIPLRELRGRLEGLTGVPPASQILSLHSTRTDDPDARAVLVAKLEDDERSLHDYGVQEGMGVVINDDRPADLASQFADDSKVEKWEMDDETYSKRRGELQRLRVEQRECHSAKGGTAYRASSRHLSQRSID